VAALSDTDFGTKGALGGTSCLIMDVPMRGTTDLEPHSLCHAPDAGQPVKFVLVNNRTPRRQSCCAICGEPIRETYLRAIATRLAYCDFRCYATVAVLTTQHRAKAS
jgi:hypothetical protein